MGKRGPKRRGGNRFPCGKLRPEKTGPTAEQIAKRVARFVIAGVKPDDKVDLRLASSWLGVLYAAGVISRVQFDAGQHYHRLYKTAYPQGFPASCLDPDLPTIGGVTFQAYSGGDNDAAQALKITNRILKEISRKGFNLVVNICGFDRFEQFIDVSSNRPPEAWRADVENKTIFLCMLDALAEAFNFQERRKAA